MDQIQTNVKRALLWKPWLSLLCLGAVSALAHAPTFWVWLLPLTFGPALWLMSQRSTALGFIGTAQLFALGHFSAGMYWLVSPLFFGPAYQLLGIPVSLFGIPGVIALCFAIPVGVTLFVLKARGNVLSWAGIAAIALAWACGDWLRSWVLTGLPWNVTAYVWGWSVPMMQSAAWVGPFGLSFVTAFLAFASARLLQGSWLSVVAVVGGGIALLALSGMARLTLVQVEEEPGIQVGLIQPAAKQSLSRTPIEIMQAVDDLIVLSRQAVDQGADVVIWSEGATGAELYRNPVVNEAVRGLTSDGGPSVITGSAKVLRNMSGRLNVTNSLSVLSAGELVSEHDKSHLVPFGEYMPMRQLFELPNLSLPGADFTAGPGIQTLRSFGLPAFSPLICYEAIFPGRVIDRSNRPQWMVNITTDGWFGDTSGPRQHLTSVRFRSVEEGLPMVRVAGAGISAVIDPFGRIITHIQLNKRDVEVVGLPGFISRPTMYASGGQLAVSLLFWLFLVILLFRFLRNIPPTRSQPS